MKNLLLAALLVALPVQAQSIAETYNKAGGKIVITDELCNDGSHHLAYTVMVSQPTLFGCWVNDNSYIHIRWYDGDLRSYPYNGWNMVAPVKPNT